MEWLQANWFWLLVIVVFIWMHRGHGHTGARGGGSDDRGDHGGGCH